MHAYVHTNCRYPLTYCCTRRTLSYLLHRSTGALHSREKSKVRRASSLVQVYSKAIDVQVGKYTYLCSLVLLLLCVLELLRLSWPNYNNSDNNNTLMPFQMLKQAPASWSRPITPSRPVNLSKGAAPMPPSPPPPTRKGKDMKGCITVCSTGSRLFSTHAALRTSDIHNSTILTGTESRAGGCVGVLALAGRELQIKFPPPRILAKAIQHHIKPQKTSAQSINACRISTAHRNTSEVGGCSYPALVSRPGCSRSATVNSACVH